MADGTPPTEAKTSGSPLLKLPAELRNAIYELVAGTEVTLDDRKLVTPSYNLASVCRQTYQEYQPIYKQTIAACPTMTIDLYDFDVLKKALRLSTPLANGTKRTVAITLHMDSPHRHLVKGLVAWVQECEMGMHDELTCTYGVAFHGSAKDGRAAALAIRSSLFYHNRRVPSLSPHGKAIYEGVVQVLLRAALLSARESYY